MQSISPFIRILAVVLVCIGMIYANYTLFNSDDFVSDLTSKKSIYIPAVAYAFTIYNFARWYVAKAYWLILACWLIFNCTIILNFLIYFNGNYPPVAIQYSQSSSLFIYCILLLFSRETFPNWLRIFSAAGLLILIPCLIFYFAEYWYAYELTVYALCCTPVLKSFIFLNDIPREETEVLDS